MRETQDKRIARVALCGAVTSALWLCTVHLHVRSSALAVALRPPLTHFRSVDVTISLNGMGLSAAINISSQFAPRARTHTAVAARRRDEPHIHTRHPSHLLRTRCLVSCTVNTWPRALPPPPAPCTSAVVTSVAPCQCKLSCIGLLLPSLLLVILKPSPPPHASSSCFGSIPAMSVG